MAITTSTVGPSELAVLKILALEGGIGRDVKISCATLADTLDASNQTASRRLQRLERANLLTRNTVSDGQWVTITDAGIGMLQSEYEQYRQIFDGDDTLSLGGSVTSGMGEGRHYISLSGYQRQFTDRLGYKPFPGTLNIDLDEESIRQRSAVNQIQGTPIDGWEDDDRTYGPAVCHPATIETATGEQYERAHTIQPERTHHDEDKLEIIAPEKLRDVLDLTDEEHVIIHVGDN